MLRNDSDTDDKALTFFAEENETRNVAGTQNDVITLNAVPLHEQCVHFRLGH